MLEIDEWDVSRIRKRPWFMAETNSVSIDIGWLAFQTSDNINILIQLEMQYHITKRKQDFVKTKLMSW